MKYLFLVTTCLFCALVTHAQVPQSEQLWGEGVQAMGSEEWSKAADIWETIVAQQPAWSFQHPREEAILALAVTYQQIDRQEKAQALLVQLLDAHPRDEWTVRVLLPLTKLEWGIGHREIVDRSVSFLLSDVNGSLERATTYLERVTREYGIVDPAIHALGTYLAAHPCHPWHTSLSIFQAKLCWENGDRSHGRTILSRLIDESPDARLDATVASLLADDLLKKGDPREAGLLLAEIAPFVKGEQQGICLNQALTAFQQAGDRQNMEAVAIHLVNISAVTPIVMHTLFSRFQVSLAAGDVTAAKRWSDLMLKASPDYPLSLRAYQLIKGK